jgi:putative transposase
MPKPLTTAYVITPGTKHRYTLGKDHRLQPPGTPGLHAEGPARPVHREILASCQEIMREVCADFGIELREFNGEADHVHYPPKAALSRLAGSLKGASARRLRQELAGHIREYLQGGHSWSPSYFAATCGATCGAPPAIIKEYVQQQKRPARTWTDAIPPGPEGLGFLASPAEATSDRSGGSGTGGTPHRAMITSTQDTIPYGSILLGSLGGDHVRLRGETPRIGRPGPGSQ